jgi:serine/threonine protein phosphatase PrpC
VRIGRYAGVTDTGRRRMRNEDTLVVRPPLFAVADGMGGARAGEIAARLAADALESARADVVGEDGVASLIVDANRRIWERSLADPATAGMGTTVTAALVDETHETVAFGHVGDSRAYRLRDGVLEQLSTDHSLVAELVESGVLTPEEAERHPQRSAITRALGTEAAVEVASWTVDGRAGDLFLLCSDGLSVMLADHEIAHAIDGAGREPQAAGEALVSAANAHGGEDNITVVLFELTEGEPTPRPEIPAEEPADEPAADPPLEPADGVRKHGAGSGGRVASLALIALVLTLGLLGLYWGISR